MFDFEFKVVFNDGFGIDWFILYENFVLYYFMIEKLYDICGNWDGIFFVLDGEILFVLLRSLGEEYLIEVVFYVWLEQNVIFVCGIKISQVFKLSDQELWVFQLSLLGFFKVVLVIGNIEI